MTPNTDTGLASCDDALIEQEHRTEGLPDTGGYEMAEKKITPQQPAAAAAATEDSKAAARVTMKKLSHKKVSRKKVSRKQAAR